MKFSILVQIETHPCELPSIKECLGMVAEQYGNPRVILIGAAGTEEELAEQLKLWEA